MTPRSVAGPLTVAMAVGAIAGATIGILAGSVGIGLIGGTAIGVLVGLVWETTGPRDPGS